jgi:2-haloalkanoic acid dehalogenase type II
VTKPVVAFDALGTLFDLGELEQRISRPLHLAVAATLVGDWVPFDELLEDVDADLAQELESVDAFVDALPALEQVAERGATAWVLTNGTKSTTEQLLERSELRGLVEEVHSVEEVQKYKPHADVYALLPPGATLIAAHHWDVLGARSAGYDAIWVNRKNENWPFAARAPREAPDLATATRA